MSKFSVFKTLNEHLERLSKSNLSTLAQSAPKSVRLLQTNHILADFSRHYLDQAAWDALYKLSEAFDLTARFEDLFSGKIVNPSENRAALHWALRSDKPYGLNLNQFKAVKLGLDFARDFAEKVRANYALSVNNRPFKTIIHLGVGGSDFGPRLLANAFHAERDKRFDLRFAANIDPLALENALEGANPKDTLIIGVSKSFSTRETLYNLNRCLEWLKTGTGMDDMSASLALISSKPDAAQKWAEAHNAPTTRIFDMPEEIGGRLSVWSSACLSCAISLGPEIMDAFFSGAAQMDYHCLTAKTPENLAIHLALLDVWNGTIRGENMRAILAYSNRLAQLPAYLQQLEMESNGKGTNLAGERAEQAHQSALWGGEGTIGQHSYHQWLHQGIGAPAEFILALDTGRDREGKIALAANALAQANTLMRGQSEAEIFENLQAKTEDKISAMELKNLAAQKYMPGGRVSSILYLPDFSPASLGALIALYEHRTYAAAQVWGINPFDQWGVELGKSVANDLEKRLQTMVKSEIDENEIGGVLMARLYKDLQG